MTIEVQCPNGHRLLCPDDRAGKQGRCPTCGTQFQVPATNGQGSAASGDTALSQVRRQGGEPVVSGAKERQIVFHCPNGHKLNGPISLQGQPGQCPQCSAKFRIPVYRSDEQGEEKKAEESVSIEVGDEVPEPIDVDQIELRDKDQEPEPEPEPAADEFVPPPIEEQIASFLPVEEPDDEDMHPLARLFAMLWNEKLHGGVVEVHLSDGMAILPDWWAEKLSGDTHAVFAVQSADGSYVMEAVAWDAVKRITVRRIMELPGGVFE